MSRGRVTNLPAARGTAVEKGLERPQFLGVLADDAKKAAGVDVGERIRVAENDEHRPIREEWLKLRVPTVYQAADHRDVRHAIAQQIHNLISP